jgi:hypothetical protein
VQEGYALLHDVVGRPALGVDDVGALEGFFHGVDVLEGAAGFLGLLLGQFDHFGYEVVAFGVGKGDFHAEAAGQADDALGHRQGLAVGGAVGPGHGDLLALELVQAAEMVGQVQDVGHGLGGVVDVALEVDHGGAVGQDAGGQAFVEALGYFALVLVAFAEVHVVPDADGLGQEADHVGGLADGLAVGDLALALVQVLDIEAQEVGGAGVGEAGAGAVVPEVGHGDAVLPEPGVDVRLAHLAQDVGHEVGGLKFVAALLPGEEEVLVVHVDLLGRQLVNQFLDFLRVHVLPPLILFENVPQGDGFSFMHDNAAEAGAGVVYGILFEDTFCSSVTAISICPASLCS